MSERLRSLAAAACLTALVQTPGDYLPARPRTCTYEAVEKLKNGGELMLSVKTFLHDELPQGHLRSVFTYDSRNTWGWGFVQAWG